jgi:hypothetical protein
LVGTTPPIQEQRRWPQEDGTLDFHQLRDVYIIVGLHEMHCMGIYKRTWRETQVETL